MFAEALTLKHYKVNQKDNTERELCLAYKIVALLDQTVTRPSLNISRLCLVPSIVYWPVLW